MKATLVSMSLLALRFAQQTTLNSSFKCGECITAGYKSCLQTSGVLDHPVWTKPANSTAQKCCLVSDDCSESSKTYACSTNYVNSVYAKYLCPFNNLTCGSRDSIILASVGQTSSLNFVLQKGDVCFYKIKTICGRLKVDLLQLDRGDVATGTVVAEFLEFEKGQMWLLNNSAIVTVPRTDGSPGLDMPFRKETFNENKH
jgi:hypothetical protein